MEKESGIFTISLDFELFWGIRDLKKLVAHGDNVRAVKQVVPRLLDEFTTYKVHATWATVGFIFFDSIEELKKNIPPSIPEYTNKNLSPYEDIIHNTPFMNEYLFAPDLVQLIHEHKHLGQEVGTHTFSHYYCVEEGQTLDDFKNDMKQAIKVAKELDIELKSLVFPRNQYNVNYFHVLKELGITSFRGNENNWVNTPITGSTSILKTFLMRGFRLVDRYINLFGHNTYHLHECKEYEIYNFPSSSYLRPYSKKLKLLEALKMRRIKKSMTHAAKNSTIYHLYWHPQDFGNNIDKNFMMLHQILLHYKYLSKKYGMKSLHMGELSEILDTHNYLDP